jgi:putative copper resistance protein D
VTALGVTVRWIHLVACVLVVGASAILVLGGRSDRPTAQRWEARILAWTRGAALLALVSGIAALGLHTAMLEGRVAAAVEPRALWRVLVGTQVGAVWLARASLLLLLAIFVGMRPSVERRADWRAARGESVALALGALGLLAAAGHAAAVEPGTAAAIGADVLHLAAAGVWVGGLLPLAALLRAGSEEAGADARPYAVLTTRRFSRLALVAVGLLALTGVANALNHVATIAGLVGTPYGRWLLLKLLILAPILALAAVNRRRLLRALSGDGPTVGRPAMRRLRRFVVAEAALALALLAVVAVMSATPPARHEQPLWPFSFRLSPAAMAGAPELRARALIGSQVAVLGAVGMALALMLRAWRAPVLAGALTVVALGLGIAIPPLAIDAYPPTYRRPTVPYHASSIAAGLALYREHCAACHGAEGAGDGPAAGGLPRRPADLRAAHTADHTAGDLFWWITHGIPRAGMPGFGGRLGEEQRWDLVNVVRALSSARAARALGSEVERGGRRLVAPDFAFAVGPTAPRALKDYRGRRVVLLVFYSLPASRPRLAELAARYDVLVPLGVEVIAVPTDADPDAIRRLGSDPPIFFPVVTEGAPEILETYRLFAAAAHAELLVDRQGYLRARWTSAEAPAPDAGRLLAEVRALAEERPSGPPPEEHVH